MTRCGSYYKEHLYTISRHIKTAVLEKILKSAIKKRVYIKDNRFRINISEIG